MLTKAGKIYDGNELRAAIVILSTATATSHTRSLGVVASNLSYLRVVAERAAVILALAGRRIDSKH